MKTITITLRNSGSLPVDASVVESSDPARFTTGPGPGLLEPGESATLDITYHEDTLPGTHHAYLIIRAGNLRIPLTGTTLQIIPDHLEQTLEFRLVEDDDGIWFEAGFLSPYETLPGSAADGWTDPGGHLVFRLERSENLSAWDHNWIDSPLSPEPRGDDWMIWGRASIPRLWKFVTIDMTMTSDRGNKSITMLKLFGANITAGMSYPYAMPSQAATLQAHLIAAGYTGTVVSSVAKSMSVVVTNWTNGGADNFPVTLSGSNVTMVKNASGANISLPGYPYAMPAQITNLQAALIAAGFPYASARVFGDEWTIFIPNRNAILSQRDFTATISPADPYTYQGPTGTGTDAGNTLTGTVSNVRATTGLAPLSEATKQFARLGVSRGPNYQWDEAP
jgi:hypothetical protein